MLMSVQFFQAKYFRMERVSVPMIDAAFHVPLADVAPTTGETS